MSSFRRPSLAERHARQCSSSSPGLAQRLIVDRRKKMLRQWNVRSRFIFHYGISEIGVTPLFDWLVVGAGFAGSVLAERLARERNQKVLVIDRRPHVGGNAFDC